VSKQGNETRIPYPLRRTSDVGRADEWRCGRTSVWCMDQSHAILVCSKLSSPPGMATHIHRSHRAQKSVTPSSNYLAESVLY